MKNIFIIIISFFLFFMCSDNQPTQSDGDNIQPQIDYLPFKSDSIVKYEFKNYPYGGSEYEYVQEGTLTWEVLSEDLLNKSYQIREIVFGTWVNKYPGNLDTPNFGPDTALTEFKVVDNLWMELNLSFLEVNYNVSALDIKKYYPNNWDNEITISNQEWWVDYEPDTYIRSIHNFHRIRLRKDFGIVYWYCGGMSTGSKLFILTLIE